MTIFFGNAGFQNTSGDVAQAPGAAPIGSSMQGNPQLPMTISGFGSKSK